MVIVERSEYKGNQMIELKNNEWDKYAFKFGYRKACLIVDCIKDIKEFIKECDDKKSKE